MVAVVVPLALLVLAAVIMITAGLIQDGISEYHQRRRIDAEVAHAASRLRRIEHDAIRRMHDVTKTFIDIEGEEQ